MRSELGARGREAWSGALVSEAGDKAKIDWHQRARARVIVISHLIL